MSDATSLYRFYGQRDDLLYVGITKTLPGRLGQHNADKQWFHLVATVKVEHFQHRSQARFEELRAIREESPAFNIADRADGDPPRFEQYGIRFSPKPKATVPDDADDFRKPRYGELRPITPNELRIVLAPDRGVPYDVRAHHARVTECLVDAGLIEAA